MAFNLLISYITELTSKPLQPAAYNPNGPMFIPIILACVALIVIGAVIMVKMFIMRR